MPSQIWKFPMHTPDRLIEMPEWAIVLHFGMQGSVWTFWAEVDADPSVRKVTRRFRVYGTGHDLPEDGGSYIGTAQHEGFVWHLFEVNV